MRATKDRRGLRGASEACGRFLRGDKPMMVMVLGALVGGGLLLVEPAQDYLEARERVEVLAFKERVLSEEIAHLEQRVEDLHDPSYVELIAREQQGLVRPGEVAFRIVPPEVDQPAYVVARDVTLQEQSSWYARVWDALERWLTGEGAVTR